MPYPVCFPWSRENKAKGMPDDLTIYFDLDFYKFGVCWKSKRERIIE